VGVATVESCAGCHNAGLPTKHALSNQVSVSSVVIVGTTADIVVTYNVKVDGVNRNDYTHIAGIYSWVYSAVSGSAVRTSLDLTLVPATVVSLFNGNYRLTIPGFGLTGATPAVFETTSFMLRVDNGNSQPQATFLAHYTTGNVMPGVLVSNQACINCHGQFVFKDLDANGVPVGHHGANPVGVEGCVVCHDRDSSAEARLVAPGTRLMGYVHGIHNSHNMPAAQDTSGAAVVGGVYYRNGSATSTFSIGFPGFMNNCSTCHDAADLAGIAATPVSWKACMSCHVGPPILAGTQTVAAGWAWAGFGVPNTGTAAAPIFLLGGTNHTNFNGTTTTCADCHDGVTAPATIAGFHNGLTTGRAGLIWDAADQSVVLGAAIDMQITGVTKSGTNLVITWTAKNGGVDINPCNTDITAGPVFVGAVANPATGQVASNMSILKGVAQGNDWVNAGQTGTVSPGQPVNVSLTTTNTVCSTNVATSTIAADTYPAAAATKGIVAIQGKPQVRFTPAIGTNHEVIKVRAKSPIREFLLADGAAPASTDLRRGIVDTAKCLACHKGSLYNHGDTRVDNNDLCVMCHNPASSEQQNRLSMGVTTAEAYDGKIGQTYDMRTMVHAVHSAGETGVPLAYYRSNGVYFFGSKAALAKVTWWPSTGGVTCSGSEGAVTYYEVYGSVANGTTDRVPTVNTDGTCNTTTGPLSTAGVWRIHNFIEVHYPQPLNNCGACHAAGWVPAAVDGSKAVAVTVDAGAAPWGNQLDDVLMGPTAASCMTCHQSSDTTAQFYLRTHAYDGGWVPKTFANGRQTLLDAVP
jgi:OmcA/MtrC family decaheme c-type cytochrome